jgi:hypothetical protein
VSVVLGVCALLAGCSDGSSSKSETDAAPSPAEAAPVVLDLVPLEDLPLRTGRLEVHGEWGSGPGEFGLYRPTLRGPTSFDVTSTGGLVIVDQVNRRVVLHEGSRPKTVVSGIHDGYYDVAVDDDTLHLLGINLGVRGGDVLQTFRVDDGSLVASTTVGDDVDSIPPGISTEHVGQIRVRGGRTRSVTIIKSDPAGTASWRLASAEQLGVVAVAASPNGVRAVLIRWTDTARSFQYVDLGPSGLLESFVMPDQHFAEMTAYAEFRFVGNALYRAASTARGFGIHRYLG